MRAVVTPKGDAHHRKAWRLGSIAWIVGLLLGVAGGVLAAAQLVPTTAIHHRL